MDANKLKKLRVINYEIGTCGICVHGLFDGRSRYGSCKYYTYNHSKHTDNPRQLSIHRYGYCKKFEADNNNYEVPINEDWKEFLKDHEESN
ncbi:hypothetical protein LCGC14_0991170 [marine sediment metagenome]|uniref:Uncharacterized protein n=1 Tax=marine sediment metagenome TaxID=412755 RepID=A0A0F9N5Q8_9ZZZZ